MQKNASNPLLWPSAHLAMAGLSFAAVEDLHDHHHHQQTYAGEGSGAREMRFEVRFYRVIALREVQVQVEGDYQTLYQTERMVEPDVVMDMTYVGVATTPTTNTPDPSSSLSSSSASTSSNSQDSPLTPSPGFSSSSSGSSSSSSTSSSSSARDSQATSTASQFSSQPSSLSSMTPPTPFTIPHSAYIGDSQASAADFSLGSLPAEFALTPTPREHHPALASTMDLEAEPQSLKRKRSQEDSGTLLPTSPNASQAERKRKPDDISDGAADAGASTFALVLAHQQAASPLLSLATPLLVFLLSHYLDYPLGYLDLLALAQSCKQLHHLLLASPATPLVWSAVHSYDFSPVGKHATKDCIAEILFRCRGSHLSLICCVTRRSPSCVCVCVCASTQGIKRTVMHRRASCCGRPRFSRDWNSAAEFVRSTSPTARSSRSSTSSASSRCAALRPSPRPSSPTTRRTRWTSSTRRPSPAATPTWPSPTSTWRP
jgi:hypothetical protein